MIRLSPDAQKLLARQNEAPAPAPIGTEPASDGTEASSDASRADDGSVPDGGSTRSAEGKTEPGDRAAAQATGAVTKPLTPEQKAAVSELAARDTAVRAHEAAHQAAAGGLGGAASFTYATGPDGRRYAVGGEVPVSLRSGHTPQETIANAQAVRSAALAPADPSAQDLAVAAQATQMEAEARQEAAQTRSDGGDGGRPGAVKRAPGGRGPDGAQASHEPASAKPTDSTAAIPAQGRADAEDDARDRDPLMVFSALKSERSASTVNGHLHGSSGTCAFCARAAARYA